MSDPLCRDGIIEIVHQYGNFFNKKYGTPNLDTPEDVKRHASEVRSGWGALPTFRGMRSQLEAWRSKYEKRYGKGSEEYEEVFGPYARPKQVSADAKLLASYPEFAKVMDAVSEHANNLALEAAEVIGTERYEDSLVALKKALNTVHCYYDPETNAKLDPIYPGQEFEAVPLSDAEVEAILRSSGT